MSHRPREWEPPEDFEEAEREWERVVEAQDMAMARRDRLADHFPSPIDFTALETIHRHEEALLEWASRIAQNAGPKTPSTDFEGAIA